MPAQLRISNPFLKEYLQYVEYTESPRLFHIWSALSGVSACMGRRAFFPFGIEPIYPNLFVLLVGPPASRKSTAVKIVKREIMSATGIRLAPDDTSGQHQGLIAAIENRPTDMAVEEDEIDAALQAMDLDALKEIKIRVDARDAHTMYACATEFGSFIGVKSLTMTRFLTKVYDGDDYDYRLKNEQRTLAEPLLSILGATTATDINTTFPKEAVGQGFMSRIIFVFGAKRYRRIPEPKALPRDRHNNIQRVFKYAYETVEGPFAKTLEAGQAFTKLYENPGSLDDPRFIHYVDRRHVHRIKIAMSLAVGRFSQRIEECDVLEADHILRETETYMPSALGEYGFSPLSAAKQQLLEYLQHAHCAVPKQILWSIMARNMAQVEFENALLDMVNSGKIKLVNTLKDFPEAYVYREPGKEQLEETLELLSEPIDFIPVEKDNVISLAEA